MVYNERHDVQDEFGNKNVTIASEWRCCLHTITSETSKRIVKSCLEQATPCIGNYGAYIEQSQPSQKMR